MRDVRLVNDNRKIAQSSSQVFRGTNFRTKMGFLRLNLITHLPKTEDSSTTITTVVDRLSRCITHLPKTGDSSTTITTVVDRLSRCIHLLYRKSPIQQLIVQLHFAKKYSDCVACQTTLFLTVASTQAPGDQSETTLQGPPQF